MALFDFLKKKELEEIKSLKDQVSRLSQYEGIVEIDQVIESRKIDLEVVKTEIQDLKQKYAEAHKVYQDLKHQSELFKETIDLADFGVYEPHFNFDSSEAYKAAILEVREKQKKSIQNEDAVLGGHNVTWNNSLSKGQAMVKREKKLLLRAFNGECDSFISEVEWNNVNKMEERIQKSFDALNKVYGDQGIHINWNYKELKIKELRLAYEYKKKKYDEKEEQRMIREQMREEEKAAREIETAIAKAQKEEESYQKALEKTKQEAEASAGGPNEKLLKKIAELEARLQEAHENKERALSMAQQTKRGHVYIISNIGAFGEDVYKIGMTRRLDPVDRVKELSDASVPFQFDIHAMIFSEDAPGLENSLHKVFDDKKVNMVNSKKEFFSVSLEEIENAVKNYDVQAEFIRLPEAMEYRETVAIRERLNNMNGADVIKEAAEAFPETLII